MRFFKYLSPHDKMEYYLNPLEAFKISFSDVDSTITFIFSNGEVFHCDYRPSKINTGSDDQYISAKKRIVEIITE